MRQLDAPVRAHPGPATAAGALHVCVVPARQRHGHRERETRDVTEPDGRFPFARRAFQRQNPKWSRPHAPHAEERALSQRIRLARLTEVFRKLLVYQLLVPVVSTHAIRLLAISLYAAAPGCVDA